MPGILGKTNSRSNPLGEPGMRYLLSRNQKAVFGFRGKIILHFAVIWFLLGVAVLITPSSAGDKSVAIALEHNHGHSMLFLLYVPLALRAALWFVSAGLAIAYARTDPSKPHDRVAWMALVFPMAVTGLCYFWACAVNLVFFGHFIALYFVGTILYGFFTSLVLALSSWPEPPAFRGDPT
jgi:hypothetical protein